jgi:hypothetical protein
MYADPKLKAKVANDTNKYVSNEMEYNSVSTNLLTRNCIKMIVAQSSEKRTEG